MLDNKNIVVIKKKLVRVKDKNTKIFLLKVFAMIDLLMKTIALAQIVMESFLHPVASFS